MNALLDKLDAIGSEIVDVDEEVFLAFSSESESHGLGHISLNDKLEIEVAGRDFSIRQSATKLQSERAGGTTGAVVWKVAPPFAAWLSSDTTAMFREGLLNANSTVLELGTGISPVAAVLVGRRVARYIASDQGYVLKLLRENIHENHRALRKGATGATAKANAKAKRVNNGSEENERKREGEGVIEVVSLDWETDDVPSLLRRLNAHVDVVLVSDCVFNEFLIEPLVSTCAAVCRGEHGQHSASAIEHVSATESAPASAICIVAQQLRDADVFEAWLVRMLLSFRVWRVRREELSEDLQEGFIVHVAVPRLSDVGD